MLLTAIGLIIMGAIFIMRGNTMIKNAQSVEDEEERLALEALGQKRIKIGRITIAVTIFASVAVLIFLGLLLQ
jgi:hypothetical protein